MGKSVRKPVASSMQVKRCQNPWNGKCRSTDIELYIMYKGRVLPICRSCWGKIANLNIEWGGGEGES